MASNKMVLGNFNERRNPVVAGLAMVAAALGEAALIGWIDRR